MDKLAVIDINRHALRVIVETVSQAAYGILYEKKIGCATVIPDAK
jgi:hypothetical protein